MRKGKGKGKRSRKGKSRGPFGKGKGHSRPQSFLTDDMTNDGEDYDHDYDQGDWYDQGYESSYFGGKGKGKRKGNPIDKKTGKPATCHNCGSTDHFASNCPTNSNPNPNVPRGKRSGYPTAGVAYESD